MDEQESNGSNGLGTRVRVLQIIILALCGGSTMFGGIVLYLRHGAAMPIPQPPELPLTYILLGVAANIIVAWLFVPDSVVKAGRRQLSLGGKLPDEQRDATLLGLFQTRAIIACALLEGATFMMLVAYLLEANPISLVVAVFLLAGMFWHFPSEHGVRDWLDHQQRLLAESEG